MFFLILSLGFHIFVNFLLKLCLKLTRELILEVCMLYLSRKIGESIMIDDDIHITITEIRGHTVKIGVTYPKTTRVLRKEIFDKIQNENRVAATSSQQITQLLQGTIVPKDDT